LVVPAVFKSVVGQYTMVGAHGKQSCSPHNQETKEKEEEAEDSLAPLRIHLQ
jgi:hypothetical protein